MVAHLNYTDTKSDDDAVAAAIMDSYSCKA